VPGHARLDLLKVDVFAVEQNLTNQSSILISLVTIRGHLPVKNHIRKVFFRFGAKSLMGFGCINALQTNPMLNILRVQHGHRVAVSDTNYATRKRRGTVWWPRGLSVFRTYRTGRAVTCEGE
jgi:hypothetical protein